MLRSNQLSYITEGRNYSHKPTPLGLIGDMPIATTPVQRYTTNSNWPRKKESVFQT